LTVTLALVLVALGVLPLWKPDWLWVTERVYYLSHGNHPRYDEYRYYPSLCDLEIPGFRRELTGPRGVSVCDLPFFSAASLIMFGLPLLLVCWWWPFRNRHRWLRVLLCILWGWFAGILIYDRPDPVLFSGWSRKFSVSPALLPYFLAVVGIPGGAFIWVVLREAFRSHWFRVALLLAGSMLVAMILAKLVVPPYKIEEEPPTPWMWIGWYGIAWVILGMYVVGALLSLAWLTSKMTRAWRAERLARHPTEHNVLVS
jgi:hypothetical protein